MFSEKDSVERYLTSFLLGYARKQRANKKITNKEKLAFEWTFRFLVKLVAEKQRAIQQDAAYWHLRQGK